MGRSLPHRAMLIGIVAGAALGLAANELVANGWIEKRVVDGIIEWAAFPAGQIFLRLLLMLSVPLIFSALVSGIAELDPRALGRMGLRTLAFTTLVSALAVITGLVLVEGIGPGRGDNAELVALAEELAQGKPPVKPAEGAGVTGVVTMIPTNPLSAAANDNTLGVIIFALVLGIGIAVVRTPNSARLREAIGGLNEVCTRLIEAVMKIAPIGVAGLLFSSFANLGVDLLAKIAAYVAVAILALAIHNFGTYSVILKLVARRNPIQFFGQIKVAMATAFATSSSAATLPTTLRVAETEVGLPRHVSRFVLTAGASMNQNGTALFEGVTVLFLAQVFGVDLTIGQSLVVMLICVLGGIGTAGIPGASLPVIAMMMAMYGVPAEGLALILGVDRLLDMCRTTVNVAGDLVVAACVARGEPAVAAGVDAPDDAAISDQSL
jgi:dicarboxylate/amino acid:cation (Na+ or H+) symporter, DAACS family